MGGLGNGGLVWLAGGQRLQPPLPKVELNQNSNEKPLSVNRS